jgi:hypothetical protein
MSEVRRKKEREAPGGAASDGLRLQGRVECRADRGIIGMSISVGGEPTKGE